MRSDYVRTNRLILAACVGAGFGAVMLAGMGLTRVDPPESKLPLGQEPPDAEVMRFRAAIPRFQYQAIVVSPRVAGRGVGTVPFIIRSRDATGTVADTAFFVPVGTTQTITFPGSGWTPLTDSVLYALADAEFSAWGVTSGQQGGLFVRFLPVERDIQRDAEDREREREFESFLRERNRNR